VRDLRVWFALRKGLLGELFGRKPQWVRAVDGVSLDIHRGEIFCLVGESGCGKTSTGKAILKLVEATSGDIFIEMPPQDYERYVEAKGKTNDPEAAAVVNEMRRKYSITWKETRPWGIAEIGRLAVMATFAFGVALVAPAALLGLLTDPFTSSWHSVGFGVLGGTLLGILGSLPPVRPARRISLLYSILAVIAVIISGIPTFYFYQLVAPGQGLPTMAMLGAAWERDLFGLLVATGFAPMTAAGFSALITDLRQRSEGLAGIRMRDLRRRFQLIFQDPYESLNPKQSVYEIVSEPLVVNRITTDPEETTALVVAALKDAGLRPPEEFMFRFPHELSGGQRQRVSIAAALVLRPDFIVADEPVSMLDVSIRTEILQLLLDLRQTRGLTYLFITHDLSLAWVLTDRVGVMYLGKIVEIGTTEQVIKEPKHPYTRALISVVPSPDPRKKTERLILKGERPDPVNIPTGCRFHPRCPLAFEKCGWNAEEVSQELGNLIAAGRLPFLESARAEDLRTVRMVPAGNVSATEAAELLGSFVRAQQATVPALRGISEISSADRYVYARLHAWEEPELIEVQPGNAVACHLVATENAKIEATAGSGSAARGGGRTS